MWLVELAALRRLGKRREVGEENRCEHAQCEKAPLVY